MTVNFDPADVVDEFEDDEPVELHEVDALYRKCLDEVDTWKLPDPVKGALAYIPGMIAELRTAREDLAEWQERDSRTEIVVSVGGPGADGVFVVDCKDFVQAEKTVALIGGEIFLRTVTVHRWASIDEPI